MVRFKRAVFLSWYCKRGDCKFCYMSTQKKKITDPKKAKRTVESILAEVMICKACGWDVEFLSGGYESYDLDELVEITKTIKQITGKKQWLNIGVLSRKELEQFKPFIKGVTGAVECVNEDIHDKVCPSKPVSEILGMFKDARGLKKAMTMIIGLGETIEDIPKLVEFIKKNKVDRITFYSLNPHPGTAFTTSPSIRDYVLWVQEIRKNFPKLEIIGGLWTDKVHDYGKLLEAGADHITKFPSIKLFGSKYAREMERQVKIAGKKFEGTMTKMPKVNWDKEVDILKLDSELKEKVKKKLKQYVKQMKKC